MQVPTEKVKKRPPTAGARKFQPQDATRGTQLRQRTRSCRSDSSRSTSSLTSTPLAHGATFEHSRVESRRHLSPSQQLRAVQPSSRFILQRANQSPTQFPPAFPRCLKTSEDEICPMRGERLMFAEVNEVLRVSRPRDRPS